MHRGTKIFLILRVNDRLAQYVIRLAVRALAEGVEAEFTIVPRSLIALLGVGQVGNLGDLLPSQGQNVEAWLMPRAKAVSLLLMKRGTVACLLRLISSTLRFSPPSAFCFQGELIVRVLPSYVSPFTNRPLDFFDSIRGVVAPTNYTRARRSLLQA